MPHATRIPCAALILAPLAEPADRPGAAAESCARATWRVHPAGRRVRTGSNTSG